MKTANKFIKARTYWPLLLPLLFYLPALTGYPFPGADGAFTDLLITHLPNLIYFKRALFEFGQFPLWSPQIMSGGPFAANPLAGVFYPPGWLALALPEAQSLSLLVLLHVLWGTVGFYVFARQLRLGHQSALFGAVAFGSMPKLLAHFASGHITLLYAVPWTPWLLWAECLRKNRSGWVRFIQPGLILALIFFADVRWAVYSGGLWVFWKIVCDRQQTLLEAGDNPIEGPRPLWQSLRSLGGQIALAGLLSAPLALPLLEFTRNSARNALQSVDSLVFSLPPGRLLGLVLPDFGGLQEWMLYPGVAVLLLGLLAILAPGTLASGRFWRWVMVLTLLISLGENIPGGSWLVQLPGFNLLRVPPRASFLTLLALIILAASALDRITAGLTLPERRRAGLFIFGFIFFVGSLAVGLILLSPVLSKAYFWWLIGLVLTGVWLWLMVHQRISSPGWFVGLVLISMLDWGLIHQSNIRLRPVAQVNHEGADIAKYLSDDIDTFRTYSPSYSLPQHTGARFHIEMVDGVDPLYLASYGSFMDLATGVPRPEYSVTIPSFGTGNPAVDNASFTPDPERLGYLNVKYVIAAFDQVHPEFFLKEKFGNSIIYENLSYRPRAWMQATPNALMGAGVNSETLSVAIGPMLDLPVEQLEWTPNRISLTAAGPGLLVLSEVAYPGWQAEIDGVAAELILVEDLLRGVVLENSGTHEVVFTFRPISLTLGIAVNLLTICILFWIVLKPNKDLVG